MRDSSDRIALFVLGFVLVAIVVVASALAPAVVRVSAVPLIALVSVVGGAVAGWIEGRARRRTGRRRGWSAWGLPALGVGLYVAAYRAWWLSQHTRPTDDGLGFALLIGILVLALGAFIPIVLGVATLVERH